MTSPWAGKDMMMLGPASGEGKEAGRGPKAQVQVCWGNRCGLRIRVGMCPKSPIN